ncbi:flagellar basal body rod protein FlgC [Ponticaulis sp.]|uniref:flagellar basal body rod protein FlgC n=1 Tax=Ponticaulis sp. TaxID=2020902 RepID=UPI000C5FFE40|nr:flagellar basal body rod protein FlgC [Ponticaulis sp.]MAJ08596.1 flagellar basal body rod protein FlgC [Ponticaulis sp.]MDF1682105.1 flagellar basal body rod protein FlgC [Ponticaulis sp.]HBJ92560.1 flagellar basal body rod protein FlgC [Hyphomonadaceae bacterium]|tara:strand:- start:33863 stop:34282 length:420 start_codon:yes stop_codon:yes gene_type:complete
MSADLFSALSAASTGLRAQTVRIRLAAENVANANSTSDTPGGDPYQRRMPVFREMVDRETGAHGVQVVRTAQDQSDFPVEYDPTHPAADENGFVKLPNVQTLIEMADIREAQRTYEANLNIIEGSRAMINRALDLLRRG